MLIDNLQRRTIHIVIIGNFNPAIMHPSWLANKKLIREEEALDAKIEIIHDQIAKFNIDWADFEITPDKFVLAINKEPYFEPGKDLLIGIFQFLKETPIKAFGYNHLMYFGINDDDKFYDIGNKLAPLGNWNGFLSGPKLESISMIENARKDELEGYYRIKVETSKGSTVGYKHAILFSINDHIEIDGEKGKKPFVDVINKNWNDSISNAMEIASSIWSNLNV